MVFVSLDILGLCLKVLNDSQFVLGMIDHYSKLTRAVLTSKKTASHIVSLSMDNWIILHGIPMHGLADNGMQFVNKFFE